MDEDVFDQMLEALHQSNTPKTPTQTNTRWQPDGTYNKKPLDTNYFSKYYQRELKTPLTCPDSDGKIDVRKMKEWCEEKSIPLPKTLKEHYNIQ